jgi:hypothetical protein
MKARGIRSISVSARHLAGAIPGKPADAAARHAVKPEIVNTVATIYRRLCIFHEQ